MLEVKEDFVASTFDTQGFLTRIKSGLAQVRLKTPSGTRTASEWINENCARFGVKPQFILTVMQAEQGLLSEKRVLMVEYSVKSLPYLGDAKPAVSSPLDRVLRNQPKKTPDGNKWVLVHGDWRMIACCGTGIPDPSGEGAVPNWDVREFLGFDKQVAQACSTIRRYLTNFEKSLALGDPGMRVVKLYGGENIVANDVVSYVLLQYTPSEKVITERTSIYEKYFGTA
jgi:hypothetical protein